VRRSRVEDEVDLGREPAVGEVLQDIVDGQRGELEWRWLRDKVRAGSTS